MVYKDEIDKLVEEHWAYVKAILLLHEKDKELIEIIGAHYIYAMLHGIKHGLELGEKSE